MSRDSTSRAATVVHHAEELEPAICSALASLLATEPTPAEVDCAMNQLRLAGDSFSLALQTSDQTTSGHAYSNQWLLVTASMFVFCMCGIASTEGWAQVAKDFSDPLNEPQPLSTLADTTSNSLQQSGDIGFALRLVLIAHVTLLLLGLAGMAITWVIAIVSCLLGHWRRSRPKRDSTSTQQRILFSSALLYSAGIVLGAIWAQATWGRVWSWDPRETFGLFTLAFAVLWMRAINTSAHSEADERRLSAMTASVATIALGAIVLMCILGSRYAAALHSYGLPASTLPNLVLGLFASCLAAIWISFALCSRFSRKSKGATAWREI